MTAVKILTRKKDTEPGGGDTHLYIYHTKLLKSHQTKSYSPNLYIPADHILVHLVNGIKKRKIAVYGRADDNHDGI